MPCVVGLKVPDRLKYRIASRYAASFALKMKALRPFDTSSTTHPNTQRHINEEGDRRSTVIKVLCYKSEGRWFDASWCKWIFQWHKILPITLWPWGRIIRLHYGPGVDGRLIRSHCDPGVYSSDRTMALGSTQPLTEMSTRNISWG